jgi:hypothetical protein
MTTLALAALVIAPAVAGAPATDAKAALERLKGLTGTWTMSGGKEGTEGGIVTYKVTGAGSAVVETLFAGGPHEMVTVYFLDGNDLVLTHYCAAGNQPRMRAKLGGDPNTLAFTFDGGTNFDPKKDMHMHEAVLKFIGPDQLRSEWQSYNGTTKGERVEIDLKRKQG